MYTLNEAEKIIRSFTEIILYNHDLNINRNDTNKAIYNKIVNRCMKDLQNDNLLSLFENDKQLEYFVNQTILYLVID